MQRRASMGNNVVGLIKMELIDGGVGPRASLGVFSALRALG